MLTNQTIKIKKNRAHVSVADLMRWRNLSAIYKNLRDLKDYFDFQIKEMTKNHNNSALTNFIYEFMERLK